MKTIILPAIEIRQNGTRLLLTKMKAGDLPDFTEIERYDHKRAFDDPAQGYQRPEDTARVKKFANWLKSEKEATGRVRMPTAILLSSRGTDISLSPDGKITLKESSKLPLIDGQHRSKGFGYAIEHKGLKDFGDYEVPVVIMQDIDKVGEMKQFRTVNGEQKSVRTDLVNMILTQLADHEGDAAIRGTDQWKVIASKIVKRLNEDKDGPWFDRIVMPDQNAYSKLEQESDSSLVHRRIARATSFISALKPIIKYFEEVKPTGQSIYKRTDELFGIIDGYWRAIREINPECFESANDFVMLKTPGIFALHRLGLSIMKDMYIGYRNWEQEQFKQLLSRCSEVRNPDYWAVGINAGDRGEAANYGSMKGFKDLGDALYHSLRS